MSKILRYKGIRYELKQTEGFYFCLVYAKGLGKVLYQTKYFNSQEQAISSAMLFIEDYVVFQAELEKKRAEKAKSKSKGKKRKGKAKQKQAQTQAPKLKPQGEQHIVPKSTPEARAGTRRSRFQDSRPSVIRGIARGLLIIAAFLLMGTVLAYAYAEFIQRGEDQNQIIPETGGTDSSDLGIPLPPLRETVGLPLVPQSVSPTSTETATMTSTATLTGTITPTQTPPPPANTQRPTDEPSATFTPTASPSNTPTDTPTLTITPSPTDTVTPTTTSTASPTLTPEPTIDTPAPEPPTDTPTLEPPTDTPSPT